MVVLQPPMIGPPRPKRPDEEDDQEAKKRVFKDLSKKTPSKNTALSLRPIYCPFRTAMAGVTSQLGDPSRKAGKTAFTP